MDPWLLPLCQASADAYTTAPWFTNSTNTCQVCRTTVPDGTVVYAFEGTKTFREWMVDFMALEVPTFRHNSAGPVHFGLWVDALKAIDAIEADVRSHGKQFALTGHSKGAGQAVLAHMELKCRMLMPRVTRCFEPPMVGTRALSLCMAKDDVVWTQTTNAHGKDVVTMVPDWPEWEHQGVLRALVVPDTYGIAQKHVVASVLAAVRTAT